MGTVHQELYSSIIGFDASEKLIFYSEQRRDTKRRVFVKEQMSQ